MIVYVDGSVTGNAGGIVGYGWAIEGTEEQGFGAAFQGGDSSTNNVAEYIAVAAALIHLLPSMDYKNVGSIIIRSDSELVVHQINGEWRVKHANLKPVAAVVHMMIEELWNRGVTVTAEWIPREKNKVADDLSRRAIKHQLKERWPMSHREGNA